MRRRAHDNHRLALPDRRGSRPRDDQGKAVRGDRDDRARPGRDHRGRPRGCPRSTTACRDVEKRAARRATALDLKYAVTDLNGWQTAYGYDDGASRPQFEASRSPCSAGLAPRAGTLTDPQERAQLARLDAGLRGFLALDDVAYAALRRGAPSGRQIFLGPRSRASRRWRAAAAAARAYEAPEAAIAARRRARASRRTPPPRRGRARRRGPHRAAPPDRTGRRPRRAGAARRGAAAPRQARTPPDQA